ncbi:hypothetical protein BKI52_38840 [marine bacterium AO1-C]|nr:hypothetical protein BKI52_38840 [marine bacterium AO1-C]
MLAHVVLACANEGYLMERKRYRDTRGDACAGLKVIKMDSYHILKSIHKVGHPMTGTVIGYEPSVNDLGIGIGGKVLLETNADYEVVIPYHYLFDKENNFDEVHLPEIGAKIKTVIKNHVDNTLYVSSRPSDLEQTEIDKFKSFYRFAEENEEGKRVTGVVKKAMPFGLFVDIGSSFIGLIDIGHTSFSRGEKLPYKNSDWPKENELVNCVIGYYRFHERQIGLGWIPG